MSKATLPPRSSPNPIKPARATLPGAVRRGVLVGAAVALAAMAIVASPAHAQHASDPTAPFDLTAEIVTGGIALSWDAPTQDAGSVTGYEILRRRPGIDAVGSFHSIESNTGSSSTTYTDTTTEAGNSYTYRVKALRGTAKSASSNYVRVDLPEPPPPTTTTTQPPPPPTTTTTQPPPPPTTTTTTQPPAPEPVNPANLAPTGLAVSLVNNRVTLTWRAPTENSDSVTGYEILRRRPFEGETTLQTHEANTNSTATTYTDATANEAGVRYVYRVKALRGSEKSRWSNYDRIDLDENYQADTSSPDTSSSGQQGGKDGSTDDVKSLDSTVGNPQPLELQNTDDEETIHIAAQRKNVNEGDDIVFTMTLSRTYEKEISTTFKIVYSEGAVDLEGFENVSVLASVGEASKKLTFAAGTTVQTITVPTVDNEETNRWGDWVSASLIAPYPLRANPRSVAVTVVDNDQKPGVPRNFRSVGQNQQILFLWDPPADIASNPITRYEIAIYYDYPVGPIDNPWPTYWINVGDATSYTWTGRDQGDVDTFHLRAVNENGHGSPASTTGVAYGRPFPPDTFAQPSNGSITVTLDLQDCGVPWQSITEYQVQWKSGDQDYDSSREITVTQDGNSGGAYARVVIDGLENNTQYWVRGRANNEYGNGDWSDETNWAHIVTATPGTTAYSLYYVDRSYSHFDRSSP